MAKAPRQVARAKENKENIIEEVHTGAWHTELLRECTQGSLVPLGQSANDLNKLQQYLSGLWMVNCAKLEFHPSIKQHHVLQIIFFSDQDGSWHCLQYICRVASGCKCCAAALGVEIWAKKGQITSTARKCNSGTLLLQLQQSHLCDWQDQGGFQDKQDYHCMVASNLRSTLLAVQCQINDQKSRALLTQQTWIALGILGERIDWGWSNRLPKSFWNDNSTFDSKHMQTRTITQQTPSSARQSGSMSKVK